MSDIKYTEDGDKFVDSLMESKKKAPEKVKNVKKSNKNVDVKCSSSEREASYDSAAEQLTITQNGLTVMVSPCKTEKQAIRIASKF